MLTTRASIVIKTKLTFIKRSFEFIKKNYITILLKKKNFYDIDYYNYYNLNYYSELLSTRTTAM